MLLLYGIALIAELYVLMKKKAERCRDPAKILLAGTVIAIILQILQIASGDQEQAFLTRKEPSQRSETWQLDVSTGESEGQVQVRVKSRAYRREEIPGLLESFKQKLDETMLGENESPDRVEYDLNFVTQMEGYPFMVSWKSDHTDIVASDGSLGKGLSEEGKVVEITAKITEDRYQTKELYRFPVRVFPLHKESAFFERLEKQMAEKEIRTETEAQLLLPEEFEGKNLHWSRKNEGKSSRIFFLSIVAAAGVYLGRKKEEEKKEAERQRIIEKTYPELVTRMTMLSGAGMTITGAFRKIAADYEKRKNNPLYQEMQVTCREMDSGISEERALHNMGVRCANAGIIKFNALLVRFMKSGSKGIRQSLREEMALAMRDRKNRAIRMGEEAGTKLLLPMIMMLVVVMVMIMTPAFTSFG